MVKSKKTQGQQRQPYSVRRSMALVSTITVAIAFLYMIIFDRINELTWLLGTGLVSAINFYFVKPVDNTNGLPQQMEE